MISSLWMRCLLCMRQVKWNNCSISIALPSMRSQVIHVHVSTISVFFCETETISSFCTTKPDQNKAKKIVVRVQYKHGGILCLQWNICDAAIAVFMQNAVAAIDIFHRKQNMTLCCLNHAVLKKIWIICKMAKMPGMPGKNWKMPGRWMPGWRHWIFSKIAWQSGQMPGIWALYACLMPNDLPCESTNSYVSFPTI